MLPQPLLLLLAAAVVLSLLLAFTGIRFRNTPLIVAAALVVVMTAGFAFSTIALS